MKNSQELINYFTDICKFKPKGTGKISFHLGCDFKRNEEEVLCIQPTKYIEKMIDDYKKIFGESPNSKISSPLEKRDHPELDISPLLKNDDVQKYWSIIGSLQ